MKNLKEKQGITLIALVITIIVLLILAGISIAMLTGENGILTQAQNARDSTERSSWEEQIDVAIIDAESKHRNPAMTDVKEELKNKGVIDDYSQVDDKTGAIITNEPSYVIEGKLDDYILFVPGMIADKNETYTDVNGDTATIPKGFEILEKAEIVNEGLVIQDENGNQYVWIPVDGILNEDGTIEDVTTNGKILLGRYRFASDGTPSEYLGDPIEETQEEHTTSGYENEVANDIEGFIQSARKNGGYYIGRYEAGDANANSSRYSYSPDNNPLVVKSGQYVYNYVTQSKASELCQNLYGGVNSDLVNRYAWDTAILFIQKYSGDSDYSRQTRLQANLRKTGESTDGTNNDVRCNIYDMAGNCREWTTETYYGRPAYPCVASGGYNGVNSYTSDRVSLSTTQSDKYDAFRPLLYL